MAQAKNWRKITAGGQAMADTYQGHSGLWTDHRGAITAVQWIPWPYGAEF